MRAKRMYFTEVPREKGSVEFLDAHICTFFPRRGGHRSLETLINFCQLICNSLFLLKIFVN